MKFKKNWKIKARSQRYLRLFWKKLCSFIYETLKNDPTIYEQTSNGVLKSVDGERYSRELDNSKMPASKILYLFYKLQGLIKMCLLSN